ncbi:hypothetical protein [Lysobacter sp. Root96]|uniref:hypothetical protein n=1 Tax=Lysobacter sp. Root96 TaxID=1736612 RepID=UPI0006FCE42B|nr:hypothetical protein [Lysobacter sp. Root96]KRD71393.1 hypothetical protein ASE45_06175 [Lysobacter sp. Root96]
MLETDSKHLIDLSRKTVWCSDRETGRNGNGRRQLAFSRAEHSNRHNGGFRLVTWYANNDFDVAPFDPLLAPQISYLPVTGHA